MTDEAAESAAETDGEVDGVDMFSVDDAESSAGRDVERIKVNVTKESVDHGLTTDRMEAVARRSWTSKPEAGEPPERSMPRTDINENTHRAS